MAERSLGSLLACKGFKEQVVDITKTTMRLRKVEAGDDKTGTEMWGVKEDE